jgi:hypothetical protein
MSRIKLAWHLAQTGNKTNAYRILQGKSEGKRPPGASRHRWLDNIKMQELRFSNH